MKKRMRPLNYHVKEIRLAYCPVCGDNRPTVFIRSDVHDELVCPECKKRENHPVGRVSM